MAARVEIRPFERRHLDRVLAIEGECFGEDAYPADLFLELHRECEGLFFVARRSRRIAGYCVASRSGTDAEIVSIGVAPEHRRAGIGSALLRHIIGRLKLRRVRTIVLTVRVDNATAIRLYRRLGFRPLGRIPRYYEDRSDALLMRKRM